MHLINLILKTIPLFLLFNCNSVKKEDSLSLEDRAKLNKLKSEIILGRNISSRLLNFYGMNDDKKLNKYINMIGLHLVSHLENNDRNYKFSVLDTDEISGFAAPGGYIMITNGAIKFAKDESEIAGILAHEIIHVDQGHLFTTITDTTNDIKYKKDRLNKLPNHIKKRVRVSPKEASKFAEYITRFTSSKAIVTSNLMDSVNISLSLFLVEGIDHKYEFAADEKGTLLAAKAGYDASSLKDFLYRLKNKHKNKKLISDTHPDFDLRIKNIEETLKKNENKINGAKLKNRFKKHKKLLSK